MKRHFVILIIGFILTGLFGFSAISLAQHEPKGGKWLKKAKMPTPRALLSTSVVNGKIYAIGGWDAGGWDGGQLLSTVEQYDPARNTWKKVKDLPTPRRSHASSVVNGKIYVFGGKGLVKRGARKGEATLSTLQVYDAVTNTWEKKADMPTGRWALSTSVVDGKIYAIGGQTSAFAITNLVEVYDPATDTWARGRPLLEKRWAVSTCVVNGKMNVVGGANKIELVRLVEEYHPAFDMWRRKTNIPGGRWGVSTSAANGKIYVIGGANADNQIIPTVDEYYPATDRWTPKREMPTPRQFFGATVVNGKIYAIGGWDELKPHATVEVYTPEGWPFAVSPRGKLATTWGTIKTVD